MTLGEFLLAASEDASPWNCSTFPADWCIALGHPDFAAKWRDTLEPAACEAETGSLVEHWSEGIGDALPVVSAPYQAGDIAVVERMGFRAGAIFTGDRWAVRGDKGALAFLRLHDAAVLKTWRP